MSEMNWKTWGLIVVLAMGTMFEVIKHLPGHEVLRWDADNSPYATSAKPYSVKTGLAARMLPARLPARPIAHMGGQDLKGQLEKFIAANRPTQTDNGNVVEKGGEGKIKKKKKDGEWEEYIDPVTGKKMRRRKKKQVAVVQTPEPVKPVQKTPEHKDKDVQAAIDEAINQGGFPPVEAKADDTFVDLEEWTRRLLTHPDLAATRLFIQQYQAGLVSADIFYKITQLMAQDSRTEMKQLAVLCAGTNVSYLSFQILVGIAKKERIGSALRNSCDDALNHYAEVGNIAILKKIMTANSEAFATVTALQKFDKSLQSHLVPTPAAPSANGQPAATSTVSTTMVSKYEPFVVVLQTLTMSRDVGVNDQAKQTLASLQAHLGTTPAATPAATPTAAETVVSAP